MDEETTRRVARALEGALAVFRDGKGRLGAADIRVQSIIAAVRSALLQRIDHDAAERFHSGSRPPFRVIWDATSREDP